MKHVTLLLAIGVALFGWAVASAGGAQDRAPLDLPSGGRPVAAESEETSPESILFYGELFEGDAFFWCLDKSGSMSNHGRMALLKAEVTRSLVSLSHEAEFGLVAFSSNTAAWSNTPRRAVPVNVNAAVAWMNALMSEGWTCIAPAAIDTLEMAGNSRKVRIQMIVVGDGRPVCNGLDTSEQALSDITAANFMRIPINTILVGSEDGKEFMQALALQNQGRFIHIQSH